MTFLTKSKTYLILIERISKYKSIFSDHHVSEVRHEHGRRLWFDVSEVSLENILVMAELRVYKNVATVKSTNSTSDLEISIYSIREFGG